MEQARDKIEKLSKHDVVNLTFILSEEGPELIDFDDGADGLVRGERHHRAGEEDSNARPSSYTQKHKSNQD